MITKPSPVSIIMPAYNASQYIGDSIKSVLSQTYEKWELIIVDDCSTDNTFEIALDFSKLDNRIKPIRLSKNFGGPAGPRNIGVGKSAFNLIAFLDSDDIWHPEKLARQISLSDSGALLFSCTSMIDFDDKSLPVFFKDLTNECCLVTFRSQSIRARIPCSSVLVSKELLRRFPFEESLKYKAVEDYHCWLRILESGIVCKKMLDPLLYYRKSPNQISRSKINMIRKIYMVHRRFCKSNSLRAFVLTLTHLIGGIWSRLIFSKM